VTPPLDEGVAKLQEFVHMLETTNSALETGAAEIDRVGQALGASASRLTTDLHALDGEVTGLEKEVESSTASVVNACHELAAAAEAVHAELPDIEREAGESRGDWVKGLGEKSSALEEAFQELESQGWSTLRAVLESEKASFERWTHEADAALAGLGHELDSAGQAVEHDASACAGSITDWSTAPMFDAAFWQPALEEVDKVRTETVTAVRDQGLQLGQGLIHTYAEIVPAVQHEATEARTTAGTRAEALAAAIREDDGDIMRAVDAAAAALSETKIEFDANAIQASDVEPRAAGFVELARKMAAAEAEIEEIRAAVEAMD
jgi:hypothetical protein